MLSTKKCSQLPYTSVYILYVIEAMFSIVSVAVAHGLTKVIVKVKELAESQVPQSLLYLYLDFKHIEYVLAIDGSVAWIEN